MFDRIIAILFIAGLVFNGIATLVLNSTISRSDMPETEKTPALLEKTRKMPRARKINRLTERSEKWLLAREKKGKE